MVHAVRMPKPGQMTEECTITAWFKREGDPVTRGEVLFEIETDKSAMEVETFDDGVLLRRLVAEGETVPVNSICAYIGAPGEELPAAEPPAVEPPAVEPPVGVAERQPTAPAGALLGAAAAPAPEPGPDLAEAPSRVILAPRSRLAISPRASRLAAEANLDPRVVAGTGPEGRILERDVRAALTARGARVADVAGPSAAPQSTASATPSPIADEEAPRPLSRMRRVIAERLTRSATTIPHFSITVGVDVTGLLALRDELRQAGTHLTVTDFVLGATARSLTDFPDVNARTDGVSVWPRRRVHLGLAVSLPAGLVVPVIRDADRLGLVELHDRAAAIATAAREGMLGVDDMTGGTFTVSNLRMFGVEEFSAIINPGETAILAVASALPVPVAIADGIAVRTIMRLTLTADHRMVDGELGARFLSAIRRRLEDPEGLRRELANT
jgi:pyruvate dehydrogenase E2 component (dihydrolipoamide acetyltransferase)